MLLLLALAYDSTLPDDDETAVADVGRVEGVVVAIEDDHARRAAAQNGLLVVQQLAVAPRQQIRRVGRGETAQLYQTLARLHQVKGKLSGVDPVRPPTPDAVGDTCDKIQV
jgi:hypothetical protein